jgi:hypothetical protein
MTDGRRQAGLLVLSVGASFGLTVLFFGFVVVAGGILMLLGLFLLFSGRRPAAVHALGLGAVALTGPLIYAALALVAHS